MDAVHRLNGSGCGKDNDLWKDAFWFMRARTELTVAPARACDMSPSDTHITLSILFGVFHHQVVGSETVSLVA
jgi:hypothetical protein